MNRHAVIAPHSAGAADLRVGHSTVRTIVPSEATGGQYTVMYVENEPGFSPPLHIHEREDEVFHLLEGTLRVACGDELREVAAPATVMLPRGVPHTFVAAGPGPARMVVSCVPGGFDKFFQEVAGLDFETETEALVRISAEYGVSYVGPPLEA